MSREEHKAIAHRFFDEVGTKGNITAIDELVSPHFINHSLSTGVSSDREGFKRTWAMFRAVFPDFHVTVDDAIAEGETVVVRITNRGTQQGEFWGIAPTYRGSRLPRSSSSASPMGKSPNGGVCWICSASCNNWVRSHREHEVQSSGP
jgi:predicted ester cyclase